LQSRSPPTPSRRSCRSGSLPCRGLRHDRRAARFGLTTARTADSKLLRHREFYDERAARDAAGLAS
jgi:hypothetical protein